MIFWANPLWWGCWSEEGSPRASHPLKPSGIYHQLHILEVHGTTALVSPVSRFLPSSSGYKFVPCLAAGTTERVMAFKYVHPRHSASETPEVTTCWCCPTVLPTAGHGCVQGALSGTHVVSWKGGPCGPIAVWFCRGHLPSLSLAAYFSSSSPALGATAPLSVLEQQDA